MFFTLTLYINIVLEVTIGRHPRELLVSLSPLLTSTTTTLLDNQELILKDVIDEQVNWQRQW